MRLLLPLALLLAALCPAATRLVVSTDLPDPMRAAWEGTPVDLRWAVAPTSDDLRDAQVLVLHRAQPSPLPPQSLSAIREFASRGGAVVAVGFGLACGDPDWGRTVAGGGWTSSSRSHAERLLLVLRTNQHPVVAEAASFDLDDRTLYDLDLAPDLVVIGAGFTPKVAKGKAASDKLTVFDSQPQAWLRQESSRRSAALLQGNAATLGHLGFRALLKRAVAWTAGMESVDALCSPAELGDTRYPVGGPSRPQRTVESLRLPPGFKARLLASEPLIRKPIAVQWDAAGRLWVAETPEYPNGRRPLNTDAWRDGGSLVPGVTDRPAQDSISVLVDTDGDGVADRRDVFHQGLELITGFCMHRDGVIAVAQGRITWLRDTDGDGKADREEDLFLGFTPGDTHFVTNGFTHAPDGWIYASTGSGTLVTHPATKREMARLSPGTFRFRPDGSAIEQIASAGGNAFGAEVTSDLEVFHNKATTGNPIQHVVLPEAVLARSGGSPARAFQSVNPGRRVAGVPLPSRAPYMQIDQVGRYSSSCSTLVVEDPQWPADYQRNVFLTEPILDVVTRELLVPDGPTYRGDPGPHEGKWLHSSDSWFLPVALEMSPAGEMVILDFYSPVVAHNDTRGPLHSRSHAAVRPDREHLHGRIYGVLPPGAKPRPVPDLSAAGPRELVAEFAHPSRSVRHTAQRLLHERLAAADPAVVAALRAHLGGRDEVAILGLWSLARLGAAADGDLARLASSPSPSVRRNAFLVAEARRRPLPPALAAAGLADPDARVQLAALRALGAAPMAPESAAALLALQASGQLNPWAAAAAAAAANSQPGPILGGLLAGNRATEADRAFVRGLANGLSLEDADALAEVLRALASPSAQPDLSREVLSALAVRSAPASPPSAALAALVGQPDLARAASAAPLVRRWSPDADGLLRGLALRLASAAQPDPAALAALRGLDPACDRRLDAALAAGQPAAIDGLLASGRPADLEHLLARLGSLPAAARARAIDGLLDRPAAVGRILDLLAAGKLSVLQLSPYQKSRLTGHPDSALARRAAEVLVALNAGGNSSKAEILARLIPEMAGPADPAKGKVVYQQACAICHRLGDEGMDVGPNLTGIGLHPPADLLLHIVDPNRMVDDERRAWAFTLRDGSVVIGLIASENNAGVTLRLPGGANLALPAANIAKREPRAQSLMPEGYESLGAEGLRNLLAYLRAAAGPAGSGVQVGRHFLVDLAGAVTADSRRGIYISKEAVDETLRFRKFGDLAANGVPYRVIDPSSHPRQANLIVLQGGPASAFARSFPREVTVPVGVAAHRLHLLGAVAGWGSAGDGKTPAMSLEIRHADGSVQRHDFLARRDFVDYINPSLEAPGSRKAEGLLRANQIRTLAIDIRSRSPIAALVLRSPDNIVVPTTAAITLETEPPTGPAVAPPSPAAQPVAPLPSFGPRPPGHLRVVLAGAGSSHDFPRHFLGTDAETLRAAGKMDVVATGDAEHAAQLLAHADVLVLSANAPEFGRERFQKALAAFADAGKGVVPLHAGVWHNWPKETGYNRTFVGGGARGHGAGTVTTRLGSKPHPVLEGLPPSFAFWDESYHVELDPGAPVTVLATNDPDNKTRKPHPSVWIVAHPKARIVCLSHGHDERAHTHPAYRRLLANAVNWAGGR